MTSIRNITLATAAITFCLVGSAQEPVDHSAHHPAASAPADGQAPGEAAARMDEHIKRMREMHEKMMQARTPEERRALLSEHLKLMQEGVTMMGGMRSCGMMGHGGKSGKGPMAGDRAGHHDMMEKCMEMMQSMMQMMVDRMSATPSPP